MTTYEELIKFRDNLKPGQKAWTRATREVFPIQISTVASHFCNAYTLNNEGVPYSRTEVRFKDEIYPTQEEALFGLIGGAESIISDAKYQLEKLKEKDAKENPATADGLF